MKKYTFQYSLTVMVFDSINGLANHAPGILQGIFEENGKVSGFPDRSTITNRFRENGKYRQKNFAFAVNVGEAQISCLISEALYIQTDIYAEKKAAKRQLLINQKNANT